MFVCLKLTQCLANKSERVEGYSPLPPYSIVLGTDILDIVIVNFSQVGSHYDINLTKLMISHAKTLLMQQRRGQV